MEMYTQIFIEGDGVNEYRTWAVPRSYILLLETPGCTDVTACNYDDAAVVDDGSCTYPTEAYLDCDGACLNDADMDGTCDELETSGCTEMTACNYNASATDDDGSCEYTSCLGCTDSGACNYDMSATSDDGSCEFVSCAGCTDAMSCNYDMSATIDDGSCDYSCQGCTDAMACNYDMAVTEDDGSCTYPDSRLPRL